MFLIRIFVYLSLISFFASCNTTEQKSLGTSSSKSSDTSIKSASFIYNVSEIILTENTTSARFIPVAQFTGAFFKVLPTLPAGLALNTTSGEISGTPTETLVETQFLVEATTTEGVEYAFLKITVLPEPPKSLNYSLTTLQFNKGQIGSFTPSTTGGTISHFSISPNLPNGLVLNATSGAIQTIEVAPGIVQTETGSSFHTITASNSSGSFSTTVLIHIKDAPPVGLNYITPSQDFIIGVTGGFNTMIPLLSLTDPEPTNKSFTISPQLPDGLELKPDGSIQGTPEETIGFSNFTVTVTSEAGSSSTIVTLNIIRPAISLTYPSPTPLSGFKIEQGIAMIPVKLESYVGGKPPVYTAGNCSIDTGAGAGAIACPAWLKLDSVTGLISGKPDTIGILTVDVTATHPDNLSALATTPAPPSTTVTFNIIENGPDDPTDIGYEDSYTIVENLPINISPSSAGGNAREYNLNSSFIANGSANALTISDATNPAPSVASFASALAVTIGPGHSIHYDSNNDGIIDRAAFIRTRTTSQTFDVVEADGSLVSNMPIADNDWYINGSLPDGVQFINGKFTGIPNLNKNGSSSCTVSVATDFFINIEGRNLDETNNLTQTGTQTITLKLIPQAIKRLGYTEGRSGLFFKNGVFELIDGTILSENISPNGLAGGTPTSFSVSPRLPRGLILDPCTGIISGKPQEVVPIKNYTITASNSIGSFSETIAISTNTLVKPTSLSYNDSDCAIAPAGNNSLVFEVFKNQSETNCYVGSAATFTVFPVLPLGLTLNSKTGDISGIPLTTDDTLGGKVYTIRATNILGFIETNVTIDVDNIALTLTDISYVFNGSSLATFTFTEGDVLAPGELIFQVTTNTPQSGVPTIFSIPTIGGTAIDITTTPLSSPPGTLAPAANTRNLSFNSTTGDFTTFVYLDDENGDIETTEGLRPTDSRELDPPEEVVSLTMNNDIGTSSPVSFNLKVIEKPLAFEYADGTNTIEFKLNENGDADLISGAATHTGGAVAIRNGTVLTPLCTATLLSSTSTVGNASDKDLVNIVGTVGIGATITGLSLDASTCNIEYNGLICPSAVLTNVSGGGPFTTGNATLEYSILAKNSGSPLGVTKNVKIHYFDRPNFLYEPGLTEFSTEKYGPKVGYTTSEDEFEATKVLNLDGNPTATSSYTPDVAGRCHQGNFQLDLLSDLPTPLTFDATDGTIENSGDVIVGRRFFELISTELNSGLNLSQSEKIAVQANYTINNTAHPSRTMEATKFDVNLDGFDDLIIRNQECDDKNGNEFSDGPCAPGTVETAIYIQNPSTIGVLNTLSPAIPALATLNAAAIRPIIYDSNETGLLTVSNTAPLLINSDTNIHMRSMTALGVDVNSALTSTGFTRGIAVNSEGVSGRIGVVIDTGSAVAIDQFTINATPTLAPSAMRTVLIDGLTKLTGDGNPATSAANTVTFSSPLANFSNIQAGDIFFDGAVDRIITAVTDSTNIDVIGNPGINNVSTWRIRSSSASGVGINLTGGAIDFVEQTDIDGDGDLDIMIAYFDASDSKSKICGIAFDGSFYSNKCTPRLVMPGPGRITDIKFANVSGDFLDEILVLVNDSVGLTNTIYTFENQSISSNIAGFYQVIDLLSLNSSSSLVRFDVNDLDGDGFADIIANDIFGDVDRDGNPDLILSGFSIYQNLNLSSDIFSSSIKETFPTLFHYPNSAGNTNDIETINFGTEKLLLHCQIDTDANALNLLTGEGTPTTVSLKTNSSCGIIGSF